MHRENPARLGRKHLRPLALSLALAAATSSAALAILTQPAFAMVPANTSRATPTHPNAAQTWTVLNCSDAAIGSLRDIIENPSKAQSGDIVDLSQLPALCGVADSTISLTTGEIAITQDALTLIGPEASEGTVTLSAGGGSRVLNHAGSGLLTIKDLTIADGSLHEAGNSYGGCIFGGAMGNGVYLLRSKVRNCHVTSDAGAAAGGGIRAGDVFLALSEVSGNTATATAPMQFGTGGGVTANQLFANYGSLHDNVAESGQDGEGFGGGAYAHSNVTMFFSTIDHNRASVGGGVVSRAQTMLVNSTVSDNSADSFAAAWYARGGTLSIWNSTIAFNHSNSDTNYGAISFRGNDATSALDLRSTIVAENTAGPGQIVNDVFVLPGFGVLTGNDDLVTFTNVMDPNIIISTADPKLGALRFNGGPTKTRVPRPNSPVLGLGSDGGNPRDQRGFGYPRSTGGFTDIGAVQFDEIFPGTFE